MAYSLLLNARIAIACLILELETGIWAIEFADEHPESEVLGIDLSPIQPESISPNVIFQVDNLELPWTFSYKFDYIHIRGLAGEIKDWPRIFQQGYQFLRPGGYIEVADTSSLFQCDDGSIASDSYLRKWSDLIAEASRISKRPLETHLYQSQLKDAGFEDVVETRYKWPQNQWPVNPDSKELGKWNYYNILDGLEAISMALLTRCAGMEKHEVEALLDFVRGEVNDTNIHAYFHVFVVRGRKP